MSLRRTVLVLMVGLFACMLPACVNEHIAPDPKAVYNQRFDLPEIKRRAKDLRPGMAKIEVAAIIGAPAESRYDVWIYKSLDRGGLIVPTSSLYVYFDRGVYTHHNTKPVILSETVE